MPRPTRFVHGDLQPNGYLQSFTDSVVNSRDGAHSKKTKEDTPLCYVHIPYVKGVSEKFRRKGNRYNVRTIFKIKHTLRSSLVKTGPESDPRETAQRACGETGRPLAVRLREHRHNLKEGLLEKCKLAQHAFEKYHRVDWDEVRILVIESTGNISNRPTWCV